MGSLGWGKRRWAVAVLAWCAMAWASADQVRVAVAANFAAPMREIAQQFELRTGHEVLVSLGATGALYAQIQQGAPFDVFVAADSERPRLAEQAGLAVAGTAFVYARGRLVLWSADGSVVDPRARVLSEGRFNKLALADPVLAPYGLAARAVLTRMGLLEATQARWVVGTSIAQAYQFVATGNADLGFVALSQVLRGGRIARGSAWVVPADWHPPIAQSAVLLARAAQQPAAAALLAYLGSPAAREVMQAHGYE